MPAPSSVELKRLVQRIAERIGRSLERSGLITRDIENAYLAFDASEEAPRGIAAKASQRDKLEHLGRDGESSDPANPRQAKRRRRQSRAPPQADRLI